MALNATQRAQLLDLISICDSDDLMDAGNMFRARQNSLTAMSVTKFRTGDNVTFDSSKRGRINGEVLKVNRKTVKVRADNGVIWSVSPSLLKIEERV